MASTEYSTPPPCTHKGRCCRRCLLRALVSAGIDVETYLHDALSAYQASYRAASRLRYDTDPAYRSATRAKWKVYRANHYTTWKAWQRQNRHLRRAGGDFTCEQWNAMCTLYKHRCAYCHIQPTRLTMDHVIPIARGGLHTWENIVPACQRCNSRKGTRPAPTYQMALKFG